MNSGHDNAQRQQSGAQLEQERRDLDRTLRWCLIVFVASSLILIGLAWYAVETGHVRAFLRLVGIAYTVLCTLFLGVIAYVFFIGHVGSSREIEAPKLELFQIEDRQ